VFETLETLKPDPILGLIAAYREDPRDGKVDLGAGVYRDEHGATPVLASVKAAERIILDSQVSKTYTGSEGETRFNTLMQNLLLGASHPAADRAWTIQTPGGSGALRVAAWLILRSREDARVWVSDPTWANHIPLLGSTGLTLETYPYYDGERHTIRFDDMLAALRDMPSGDIVLLHGSCHNPTGAELSSSQWDQVADLMHERGLLPFFDTAYLGFANPLAEDSVNLRRFAERFPEMILASSCSKNFGLYCDRVGALTVISADKKAAAASWSQAVNIVRRIYSVPPNHGAGIVATILGDDTLRAQWSGELDAMRARLDGNRNLLVDALGSVLPERDFSHLRRGRGMFAILGVDKDQVARLRDEFAIYMVDSSRINVAGVSEENAGYLADAVARTLT
jgi:aspartate/tyrosine/aromatic aminotransferase